jgi:hypothetical protein
MFDLAGDLPPMNHNDLVSERNRLNSSDVYIEFLSRNIGVSREEILAVARHSGISARRMAEYLVSKNLSPVTFIEE